MSIDEGGIGKGTYRLAGNISGGNFHKLALVNKYFTSQKIAPVTVTHVNAAIAKKIT